MAKRVLLFVIVGAMSGAILGSISAGAFARGANSVAERAAFVWAALGIVHGLVLFFSSLGDSPTIEDTRANRFVASNLADSFDYRCFGHRIPYIAVAFGLLLAFVVSPVLSQDADVQMRSTGTRLIAGFALSFIWTAGSMLVNTVIVAKIALRRQNP
jgi:hypothetical protein